MGSDVAMVDILVAKVVSDMAYSSHPMYNTNNMERPYVLQTVAPQFSILWCIVPATNETLYLVACPLSPIVTTLRTV